MAKKDFQVQFPVLEKGEHFAPTTPFIYRVEEEGTGMTWRDAKKALRSWYLGQANLLRSYTEKFFTLEEAAWASMNDEVEEVHVAGQVESGAVSDTRA